MPKKHVSTEVEYQPKNLRLADKWRDWYNPLVNLRVRQVTNWLYDMQIGIVSNIQWLYRFVERRDPTICAMIARRTSAIKKLDWDVKTISEKELPAGFTMKDAEAQQQALQENYDRIDNIPEAIEWLALGQFRGYAHLEKHYNAEGDVIHLEAVPQWNWARAGLTGDWFYNEGAYQIFADPDALVAQLVAIDASRFIIREVSHPIHEAIVINWIRKSMNLKDWDAYIEVYGLPPLFIIMPPNAPVDGNGVVNPEYQAMAERIVSDSRGAVPHGTDIKTVTTGSQATNPFKDHSQYIDEQAVLAGTGGLLTMLAKSGTGTLAGAAHKDTFDELAEAEAVEISSILNSQLDKQILDTLFPGQPHLAWFQLEAQEGTDTSKVIADAANLRTAGFQVDIDQLMEKTGYNLTLAPTTPDQSGVPGKSVKAPPEVTNRYWLPSGPWGRVENRERFNSGRLLTNAMKQLAPAQARQFDGVLTSFRDEVLAGDDAGLSNRWSVFQTKLPDMLKKMAVDPETTPVFKNAFTTGYIAGLFTRA
jgi:phage gp29-like protein